MVTAAFSMSGRVSDITESATCGCMRKLTVWASSLSVEEEDALVHDTTDGSSSRDQATSQTTGSAGCEWHHTINCTTSALHTQTLPVKLLTSIMEHSACAAHKQCQLICISFRLLQGTREVTSTCCTADTNCMLAANAKTGDLIQWYSLITHIQKRASQPHISHAM